jgi:hypothetical protein
MSLFGTLIYATRQRLRISANVTADFGPDRFGGFGVARLV